MISAITNSLRLARAGYVLAREGVFRDVDPTLVPLPARMALRVSRLIARPNGNSQAGRLAAALTRLGPPPFDDADRELATKFQATLSDEDIRTSYRRVGMKVKKNTPLCDEIVPLDARGAPMMGSTDVGDVSWVVPTVQARGATYAIGTPGHSWQLTAQGKMPAAHKGLVHVAKVMAGTALDAIHNPELIAQAKADHQARVAKTPYVCPIPDDVAPPIHMSA